MCQDVDHKLVHVGWMLHGDIGRERYVNRILC